MTFSQHLVLWLHVAFVIFTIGPVTLAIMSTPRYIRKRDAKILRYLSRITVVFTFGSLGVLIAGVFLAQMLKEAAKPWVIVSGTLYVVAVLLLLLIVRDQRRAIRAVEALDAEPAPAGEVAEPQAKPDQGEAEAPPAGAPPAGAPPADPVHVATVERGRIAMTGGVVSLIWLVILVLMAWNA